MFDIGLRAVTPGERADEFASQSERNQAVAGEGFAITIFPNVSAALELGVELQCHGLCSRVFDQHAFAFEHDRAFTGGQFQCTQHVVRQI
ncbi:MAG: hypothetical protein IH820_06170, partial [Bacteroidetes bacterium]|nr:hypothetical protein [Bacteroidota bacterium]